MNTQNKFRGLSLVEIIIALLILAILFGIAIPGYYQFMLKTKRAEARTALTELSNRSEQFFLDRKRYPSDWEELGYQSLDNANEIPIPSKSEHLYTLQIYRNTAAQTPLEQMGLNKNICDNRRPCFIIIATSNGNQQKDECDRLGISSDGKRNGGTFDGSAIQHLANGENCW